MQFSYIQLMVKPVTTRHKLQIPQTGDILGIWETPKKTNYHPAFNRMTVSSYSPGKLYLSAQTPRAIRIDSISFPSLTVLR